MRAPIVATSSGVEKSPQLLEFKGARGIRTHGRVSAFCKRLVERTSEAITAHVFEIRVNTYPVRAGDPRRSRRENPLPFVLTDGSFSNERSAFRFDTNGMREQRPIK